MCNTTQTTQGMSSKGTKRKRAADTGVRDQTFEKPLEELAVMWVDAQADIKARTKETTEARKSLKLLEAALFEKMRESKLERVVVDDKTIVRSKTLNLAAEDDEPVAAADS